MTQSRHSQQCSTTTLAGSQPPTPSSVAVRRPTTVAHPSASPALSTVPPPPLPPPPKSSLTESSMALNMLTPDLLDLLIRFNAPFGQTADDFHHCILGEDEFTRIRELFFTVEVLAGCEDPMECLKQLRGGQRKHGLGAMDAQDLLAFMLNSEFILYAVHRDFDIAMNPNLANWVRMCQSTAETQGNGDASSTLLQRIQRIRVALVKGILGGQGEAVSKKNKCVLRGRMGVDDASSLVLLRPSTLFKRVWTSILTSRASEKLYGNKASTSWNHCFQQTHTLQHHQQHTIAHQPPTHTLHPALTHHHPKTPPPCPKKSPPQ